MSLKEYGRKRRFDKTSEPAPKEIDSTQRSFVIQRHDARSLHFDLRLQTKGVLASWAVPKGLPAFKGDKKLAVRVEDHPVEYRDFKGIIPSGQYGAGTVDIWDRGYYVPDGDFERGLDNGKAAFYLKGEKIDAGFSLVKFRGNNWLLLIHDIDNFLPELHEIGKPSPMPEAIEPMKAILVKEPFDSKDWFYEIKWDGIRAVSYIKAKELSILSRNRKEQAFRYPELSDIGQEILGRDMVVDGEIVALDEKGVSSFQKLQQRMNLQDKKEIDYWSRKMPVIYYLFDILYWDGRDLRDLPLTERRDLLEKVVMPTRFIKISETIDTKGTVFFEAARQKGLEGIIGKKKSSKYEFIRSANWKKMKVVYQQETVIGGFTEPRGSRPYFGSLLLGVYENGQLIYAGHTGSGFSDKTLEELYSKMRKLETGVNPFQGKIKTNEKAHWLKPELVAEVRFTEWTAKGSMRHPVFIGLRTDIEPGQVVREIPAAA